MVEYFLQAGSARTVLEALYSGTVVSEARRESGSATLVSGALTLSVPLGLLVDPLPGLGIPISAADTLMLAAEVCEAAGWARCLDFLWVHRNQPIYATLYATAAEKVSSRSWVLSHALQILQHAAHVVAVSSFLQLLDGVRSATTLEQRLEATMGAAWELTLEQAEALFYHTSPFELRPSAAAPPSGPGCSFRVAGHADVFYPLRDWCFLAILCSAHANVIWPDDPPAVFCSGDHQTAALAI